MASDGPALGIGTREELVSLLYEAAELEHGLSCSYLFAAFSLKEGEGSGFTAEQADAVRRWRDVLTGVATEEMLHLALVSNLLTALGAAPNLHRPAFPQRSSYYPAGITIGLRRFDDATLTRFVHLERPDGVDADPEALADPAVESTEAPDAPPGALLGPGDDPAPGPEPDRLATVGQLYQAIEDGFERLVEARGERGVFIGHPGAQATEHHFRFPNLVAVTDLTTARRAVEVLVTQGEGVRGDWEDAHYGSFRRLRQELRALSEADPGFDPAWPVLDDPGRADVDDPVTVSTMQLFDNAYALMTTMLLRFFAHTDESDEALRTLVQTAIGLMADVIRPLGHLLVTLPAGPSHADATAGPAFGLHREVALVPHRRAAWLVFHERLVELAAFAERLAAEGGPAVLAEVAAALTEAAGRLEPHLEQDPLLPLT